MPRPNDFSDRATYYVKNIIPQAIARVRDIANTSPLDARKFLMEKLRFNDNSDNEVIGSPLEAFLITTI